MALLIEHSARFRGRTAGAVFALAKALAISEKLSY
jgi:hypothetical protein